MSFNFVTAENFVSVQDVQSENVLSMATTSHPPRTLEQSRTLFNNFALSIDEFRCSHSKCTFMSPLSSYVRNAVGCTIDGMHILESENYNILSGSKGVHKKGNDYTVGTSKEEDIPYTPFGMVYNNGLPLSMSCFPQHIFHTVEAKPQYSYIGLIAMAILSSSETKLVLSDIYQYILDNYPYFRARGPGWRNSIRHNLSLNDCFIKSGRSANGKGHYWAIHPANIDDFRKGDFRRRKAQRKVRKHMGLPFDAAGTDSPSPPLPHINQSSPPPMLALANSLYSAPRTDSASQASYEIPLALDGNSLNCIPQKHQQSHYQILPSYHLSLPYTKHMQQMRGTYFNSEIMEHHTSLPPNLYDTNRHTSSILSHKQCTGYQNNKLFNSLTQNNTLFLLSQQNKTDSISLLDTSKQLCCSRTTAKRSSNSSGSLESGFKQTRKRQFDVASLLAPDSQEVDPDTASKEIQSHEVKIATLEQTNNFSLVRGDDHNKQQHDSSLYSHQLLHRQLFVTSAVQQQIRSTQDEQEEDEIVDVVASDIEDTNKQELPLMLVDKENDVYVDKIRINKGSQTLIGNSEGSEDAHVFGDWPLPTRSNSFQEQFTDLPKMVSKGKTFIPSSPATHIVPIPSKTVKTGSRVDYITSDNRNSDVNEMQLYSHLNAGIPVTSHSILHRNKNVERLIHQFHKHNGNLKTYDDLNIQAFGHYYGAYMAAAAAHIETLQLAELHRQKHPIKIQKIQNQQ